jgi:hypothetical protein
MSNAAALSTIPCPNCRQQMQARDFEHNYRGDVRVDLCLACGGIWFDHLESVELAPAAVIELFKEINAHLNDARRPLSEPLRCPRCEGRLSPSVDLCKSGRFSYFRCVRGDGRFTPFLQFLREKQFVRSLTTAELQRVRSQVRQISCSECGAPIDLEHASQCQYCQAPVSFLDPDAVERAMRMWSEAENRRRRGPTPEAVGSAVRGIQLPPAVQCARGAPIGGDLLGSAGAALGMDLVALGMTVIGRLFQRGD